MKSFTLKTLCLIAIFCGSINTAFSQEYPNRPIRVIVPFAPGGVVDVTTRLLTQKMTERLGWNFIVENNYTTFKKLTVLLNGSTNGVDTDRADCFI